MTKKEMRLELDRLCEMSVALQERLTELRKEMHNRPPMKKGRRTSAKVTPELIAAVKDLKNKYPEMSQVDLSRAMNVHSGRISEILSGKRV